MESLSITTYVVSLNPMHGEVYSIKHFNRVKQMLRLYPGNMLPISGLRGEETCYLLLVSEKRKHAIYQWSPRRGNLLPISGLGEEEACYIAVISEERKHVTFQAIK